jgi:2-polyprenyl-3-methyl-5-hydroxy-6-metoxy-1,4-benzoquinol methylase
MKNNDRNVSILPSVPQGYKQERLDAWSHLSFRWLSYSKNDTFHRNSLNMVVAKIATVARENNMQRGSFVDLGCGPGLLLHEIQKRELFAEVVGIDFCNDMINVAKNHDQTAIGAVDYHALDLEKPLPSKMANLRHRFDIASATFLLDEVSDLRRCLQSAINLLRSHGHLIVATLAPGRERERFKGLIEENTDQNPIGILLRKTLFLDGSHSPFPYFRIIRHNEAVVRAAEIVGFKLKNDQIFKAADLASRSDGPFLRLTVLQRKD